MVMPWIIRSTINNSQRAAQRGSMNDIRGCGNALGGPLAIVVDSLIVPHYLLVYYRHPARTKRSGKLTSISRMRITRCPAKVWVLRKNEVPWRFLTIPGMIALPVPTSCELDVSLALTQHRIDGLHAASEPGGDVLDARALGLEAAGKLRVHLPLGRAPP